MNRVRTRVSRIFGAAVFAVGGFISAAYAQDVSTGAMQAHHPVAQAAAGSSQSRADPSGDTVQAEIKKRFSERFPGLEPTAVTPTPFGGLYEIQLGGELLYTNEQVDYLMQGALIDAKNRRDLTAERLAKLSEVPFEDLPLDLAVKQVRGKGERKIAVFEDPNCGYCRMLHQTLQEVDNVTVYTLLYPILGPDSRSKAENIWCAEDSAQVWRTWMLNRTTPPSASCDAPIDQILALGQKLQVRGTPAIFFEDGSRVNGALPLPQLVKKLDALP